MITNSVLGIIFTNSHDAMLGEITAQRSMGSVPFGGKYRLIDFSLSNLANGGVGKVGIITKSNYYSLMTHIGNGKPWDLDRKIGGLSILPPYASADAQIYKGKIEALYGILEYLIEATEDYVVLCDADVVANIDIRSLLKKHKSNAADITVTYTNGKKPQGQRDSMSFSFDEYGRVNFVSFDDTIAEECSYSLDTLVIGRELLIEIVTNEMRRGNVSLSHGIFAEGCERFKIFGFKHEGFAAVMDGVQSYYNANMALLDKEVRNNLFGTENPIYTKNRDDMPARYGLKAKIQNSLIADGCIIEGNVKNSILFRGVKVAKGATVENCILMDSTQVMENARVCNIITDRNVEISEDKILDGKVDKYYIKMKEKI